MYASEFTPERTGPSNRDFQLNAAYEAGWAHARLDLDRQAKRPLTESLRKSYAADPELLEFFEAGICAGSESAHWQMHG